MNRFNANMIVNDSEPKLKLSSTITNFLTGPTSHCIDIIRREFRIGKKCRLKLCPLTVYDINLIKPHCFLEIRLEIFLRALNNQSCKRPLSDLLRHRKFQKLTSSLLVTHHMQQEIICIPKCCDIKGVWKVFQF